MLVVSFHFKIHFIYYFVCTGQLTKIYWIKRNTVIAIYFLQPKLQLRYAAVLQQNKVLEVSEMHNKDAQIRILVIDLADLQK